MKRNNVAISILVYRKPTHTKQNLHYSFHHQKSCKKNVVSFLFNRAYSIITNKDDLRKENTEIKQVLRENGYQESIISKIFKRITDNNHSLPQSQQLTQATDIQEEEIRMSINLTYIEGISEKLRRISRSHKIRSTFCSENTLRKLLCKPKDRVVTEDKKDIFYQIVVSVKQSTSMNLNVNLIVKHRWKADHNFSRDQKKVVDRKSRLIPWKIKETIYYLKNPNHINKISYMLPEIWLPNLR